MFTPRLTSNGIYNSPWWYSSGNIYYSAYQLPNCTCYCYGRYAEILGEFKALPQANAGDWYRLATAFNRGQTPALGAIACWYSPNAAYYGHVAVVDPIFGRKLAINPTVIVLHGKRQEVIGSPDLFTLMVTQFPHLI